MSKAKSERNPKTDQAASEPDYFLGMNAECEPELERADGKKLTPQETKELNRPRSIREHNPEFADWIEKIEAGAIPSDAAKYVLALRKIKPEDLPRNTFVGCAVFRRMLANDPTAVRLLKGTPWEHVIDLLTTGGQNSDAFISKTERRSRASEAALKIRSAGRRPSAKVSQRELTRKQLEAVQIVGECKGSVAEAARRLGRDRKTIEQHYTAGMQKLGQKVVKHSTQPMPSDSRGQASIADNDDGPAAIGPRPQVARNRRE